jgi:bifunctional non-homologous end joining protein LigD
VRGRPLTLVRAGKTIEEGTVFMRHSKVWGPSALRRVRIQEKTKVGEYLVADDIDGVLGLVHMGVVEIHTWNSVAPEVDLHDRVVLDLDPDVSVPWTRVVETALMLRERLELVGLASFVKTTGGKGLHVVVPIDPAPWKQCLDFSRAFSEAIVRNEPKRFTTEMPLDKRRGKILIDYLRNNRTNTSVAAFSTRARPGAPVSMTVSWEELGKIDPSAFTLFTVPKLLARRKRDPWAGYDDARAPLPVLASTARQTRSAVRTSSSGASPTRRSPRS